MPTGTYTQYDMGIRRAIKALGANRNFEPALCAAGTVQYQSNYQGAAGLWWVDGNHYTVGQALPFDSGTSPKYYTATAIALLQRYWEFSWIDPTS